MQDLRSRTIADFTDQWSVYGENEGYYASLDLMRDILGPLLAIEELRGAHVGDIGSGTGRIVRILLEAGAAKVVAVEPSEGVQKLGENTRDASDRVEIIHDRGEALPPGLDLDYVTSIGVIQFIPDPGPVLQAARAALRPGGRIVMWVYGREGIGLYLQLVGSLRHVTTRLPHTVLSALCDVLNAGLDVYIWACRWLPLPLRGYVRGTLARISREMRKLTIYDQLNPSYVRYFGEREVEALLQDAGFDDVQLHHRRGYSWTAIGTKPG